jgi:hypothetical protein
VENVGKDELFANDPTAGGLGERVFTVTKLSLGGYHSVPVGRLAVDVGGLVSTYGLPRAIQSAYGRDPTSFMLFTRVRVGAI